MERYMMNTRDKHSIILGRLREKCERRADGLHRDPVRLQAASVIEELSEEIDRLRKDLKEA